MPHRLVLQLDDRTLHIPLAEGELTLGSADGCDVRIPHYTVSRRHARLHVTGAGVALTDLGSSNGTLVDGRRIDGRVALAPGQPIAFGSVEGTFERVAADELEPRCASGPAETTAGGASPRRSTARPPSPSARSRPSRSAPCPTCSSGRWRTATPAPWRRRWEAALSDALPCSRGRDHRGGGRWRRRRLPRRRGTGRTGGRVAHRRGPRRPADDPGGLPERAPGGRLRIPGGGRRGVARTGRPDPTARADQTGRAEPAGRRGRRRPLAAPDGPAPPDPPSVVPTVRRLYEDAARVAPGDVSVLICGESGTGKELLARFLHAASGRPEEQFVALNCAALPRDLLEAELFGVEEGAATGVAARAGKFELADGGTLFLDEIGDMALATQAKILRALQEGEVYRLGGRSPHPARARVISATNRNVDALLADEGPAPRPLPPDRRLEGRAAAAARAPGRTSRTWPPTSSTGRCAGANLRSAGISRAAMDVLDRLRLAGQHPPARARDGPRRPVPGRGRAGRDPAPPRGPPPERRRRRRPPAPSRRPSRRSSGARSCAPWTSHRATPGRRGVPRHRPFHPLPQDGRPGDRRRRQMNRSSRKRSVPRLG